MPNTELESIILRLVAKFAALSGELEHTRAELESARAELLRLGVLEVCEKEPPTELSASDWSRLTRLD